MNKISQVAKARAERQRQADPDHFKKLGRNARKNVKKPYYHFRELKNRDPDELERIAYRGGRKPMVK